MKSKTTNLDYHHAVLEKLHQDEAPYALIGGHAVSLWNEQFNLAPLASKDIDIRSTELIATGLASYFGWGVQRYREPNSDSTQLFVLKSQGSVCLEVWRRVEGVENGKHHFEPKVFSLTTRFLPFPVKAIDLHSLILSKIETICDREERNTMGERNDLEHLRCLLKNQPAFLQRFITTPSQRMTEMMRFQQALTARMPRIQKSQMLHSIRHDLTQLHRPSFSIKP